MAIVFANSNSNGRCLQWDHMRVITISGLATAILCFRCWTMSASVGNESIESGVPENMGVAVEILILAVLELEIWGGGQFDPPLSL